MYKGLLRNGDVVSAAVLAALGVYIVVESMNWSYYGEDGPGPAFFPAWYGVAMVLLSLVLIATTITKPTEDGTTDWSGVGRALVAWAVFAGCALSMVWLGFLVSFAILTFVMITFIFRQSMLTAALVAVCASAAFYLIFPVALSVTLPTGVFGF